MNRALHPLPQRMTEQRCYRRSPVKCRNYSGAPYAPVYPSSVWRVRQVELEHAIFFDGRVIFFLHSHSNFDYVEKN